MATTDQGQIDQASATAKQQKIDSDNDILQQAGFGGFPIGRDAYSPVAAQAGARTQADLAGVNTSAQVGSAGGIAGFFGAGKTVQQYTAGNVDQTGYDQNRAMLLARMGDVANGSNTTMQAAQLGPMAQSGGADLNQQRQLGNALMMQANGYGPSVAGSQLQQSTEQNLQASLAQAASTRGGNLGAAQYALGNARANIQQQAAQGLAQTRIQEQMAARAQAGQVLNNADTLQQQNQQFNAGQLNTGTLQQGQMNQQANLENLHANVQQDQFRQELLNKLQAGQISLDQYNTQLQQQQNQFNASLLAQQEAARQGIALGTTQTAGQAAGSAAGAIATGIAAAL